MSPPVPPQPEPPAAEAYDSAHEEQLYVWRWARFFELGAGDDEATLLALAGADWHRFADLIRGGCPVACAIRIVRP